MARLSICCVMLSVFTATMADVAEQGYRPLRIPRVTMERTCPPRQMHVFNDISRQILAVDEAHSGLQSESGTEIIPFTGKGVVIGIVDCGIDPRHPAFKRSQTDQSRVALYITTSSAAETPDDKLHYKIFHPIDGQTIYKHFVDFGSDGHGTHTAATAAGADCGFPYYGIAPDATLVLTSIGDALYEDEIELGITSALDYAREQNMPCVTSLSLGSTAGMHDGSGAMTELLSDELDASGQIVCFAAGNDGANKATLYKDFAADPTPLRTALYCNWDDPVIAPNTYIVSQGEDVRIAFSLVRIGPDSPEEVWVSPFIQLSDLPTDAPANYLPDCPELAEHLDGNNLSLMLQRVEGFDGNKGIALTGFLHWANEKADYTLGIVIDSPAGKEVYAFTDCNTCSFGSFGTEGYTRGDSSQSLSDYCTSPYVISVGAVNARQSYTDIKGNTHFYNPEESGPAYASCPFSSYGTIPEKLPHTMASGTDVISAVHEKSTYTPICALTDPNGLKWLYGVQSGTSMSTPAIAGVIALWLQANPKLTRSDILDVLQHAGNPSYGGDRSRYGVPSAYEGLKYILENLSSVHSPGLDYAGDASRPNKIMVKYIGADEVECVVPFPTQGGQYSITSIDGRKLSSGSFTGNTFRIQRQAASGIVILNVTTPEGEAVQKIKG